MHETAFGGAAGYGICTLAGTFKLLSCFRKMMLCRFPVCCEQSKYAHKIPLPTGRTQSFCGARRRKYWIAAVRRSADIVRSQISAALTAATNVNAGHSQHDLPCGQLAVGGHGRFCPRQPLRQLQPRFLLRVAQKPVVADLHKTLRQNVHQDAANKLYGWQRHDLLSVAVPVIAPLERDRAALTGKDTLVGNRYAVRITSEIFQHMTCALERGLTVDDPFLVIQRAEKRLKCRLRLKPFAVSVQNQSVFYGIQLMQKFAAKFSAENLYRQEKSFSGLAPLSVWGQNAARNDLVDMRMKLQVLSPCVKDRSNSRLPAQMLPALAKLHHSLCADLEQQIIHELPVSEKDRIQLRRHGKNGMKITGVQKLCAPVVQPVFLCHRLALVAMPVAAGIVGDLQRTALVAAVNVTAELCSPAGADRGDNLELLLTWAVLCQIIVNVQIKDLLQIGSMFCHRDLLRRAVLPDGRTFVLTQEKRVLMPPLSEIDRCSWQPDVSQSCDGACAK